MGTYSFDAGTAQVTLTDEANGYVIADALMLEPAGAAPNTATWHFDIPASGDYEVYAKWTAHANRATDAPYTIHHAAGATPVAANQQQGGGQWHLLGTHTFDARAAQVTLTDQASGIVVADAVRLVPVSAPPPAATGIFYVHADHLGTPRPRRTRLKGLRGRPIIGPMVRRRSRSKR